jgi:hypothetical protein
VNDDELPLELKKSIIYCVDKNQINEFVSGLLINYKMVKSRTLKMLCIASKTLKLDVDQLITRTDYTYKDQRYNRINNAFAEIRAVNALSNSGFLDISLVSANNKFKNVDIYASIKSFKYAIDVAHYSNYNNESSSKRFYTSKDFERYFGNTLNYKYSQLESSIVESNANRKMLFFVIDEITSFSALKSYDDQNRIFKCIFEGLKKEFKLIDIGILYNSETFLYI